MCYRTRRFRVARLNVDFEKCLAYHPAMKSSESDLSALSSFLLRRNTQCQRLPICAGMSIRSIWQPSFAAKLAKHQASIVGWNAKRSRLCHTHLSAVRSSVPQAADFALCAKKMISPSLPIAPKDAKFTQNPSTHCDKNL